jgi:hypothetical protein
MARRPGGTRGGWQTDEWFPDLESLELDQGKFYPQKAIESHIRIWKALYWLRRRIAAIIAPEEGAAAAEALPPPITFTPFLPDPGPEAKYGYIGIRDIALVTEDDSPKLAGVTTLKWKVAYVSEVSASILYGTVQGLLDGTTDPVNITASFTEPAGASFAAGNFLVMNNPDANLARAGYRSYEIMKILARVGNVLTCMRHFPGTPADEAMFGSLRSSHPSLTRFYKVDIHPFQVELRANEFEAGTNLPPLDVRGLNQACVVGIAAYLLNGAGAGDPAFVSTASIAYSLPAVDLTTPPAPGMRTLTGSEYILQLDGALSVGQTMVTRVAVSETSGLRSVWGTVMTAPEGAAAFTGLAGDVPAAALVWYLLYVDRRIVGQVEDDRPVGLVAQLAIASGGVCTYDPANPPESRRMPYALNDQAKVWPTSTIKSIGTVGTVRAAIDAYLAGTTPEIVLAFGSEMVIRQGGEWDQIVVHKGADVTGSDLTTYVQG